MKNNTSAMSAKLDTQIASVEAALEINSKRKILRVKVEELIHQAFPCSGYPEDVDMTTYAMLFFRFGVEDVLLNALEWVDNGADTDLHPSVLEDFYAGLGFPNEIAEARAKEESYVLDELISEAPDETPPSETEEVTFLKRQIQAAKDLIACRQSAAFIAEAREEIENRKEES